MVEPIRRPDIKAFGLEKTTTPAIQWVCWGLRRLKALLFTKYKKYHKKKHKKYHDNKPQSSSFLKVKDISQEKAQKSLKTLLSPQSTRLLRNA